MPVKIIKHSATGKTFALGRRAPLAIQPRLKLGNYLLRSLPPSPPSWSYAADAAPALSKMYLNDTLGDCVIAGMAHLIGVFTGNANPGKPVIFSDAEIITLYSAIGGYVPGDPSTDNGADEQTALNYWREKGAPIGANKILNFAGVNAADQDEVKFAIYNFENGMLGLSLPDEWVNNMPSASGFTWNVAGAPNPENGHCVVVVGYADAGVTISTWGMTGTITWAALAKYAVKAAGGEFWTIFTDEIISKATAKTPIGLDATQLAADDQALAA